MEVKPLYISYSERQLYLNGQMAMAFDHLNETVRPMTLIHVPVHHILPKRGLYDSFLLLKCQ